MDLEYSSTQAKFYCSVLGVEFVNLIEDHVLEDGMYKRKGQFTHIYHIDYKVEFKHKSKNLVLGFYTFTNIYKFAVENNLLDKTFEEIYVLWKIK